MGKAVRGRRRRVARNLALVTRVVEESRIRDLARSITTLEEYDAVATDCTPELRTTVLGYIHPFLRPSLRHKLRLRGALKVMNPFARTEA